MAGESRDSLVSRDESISYLIFARWQFNQDLCYTTFSQSKGTHFEEQANVCKHIQSYKVFLGAFFVPYPLTVSHLIFLSPKVQKSIHFKRRQSHPAHTLHSSPLPKWLYNTTESASQILPPAINHYFLLFFEVIRVKLTTL